MKIEEQGETDQEIAKACFNLARIFWNNHILAETGPMMQVVIYIWNLMCS